MMRNTTLNLPDALVARVKSYAAAHGTTMTAIVREHLEAVTSDDVDPITDDQLLAYSQGRLARNEAFRLLGLRDYAELRVALRNADLKMPPASPPDVCKQTRAFTKLWEHE